jgi:hypothetical protein
VCQYVYLHGSRMAQCIYIYNMGVIWTAYDISTTDLY